MSSQVHISAEDRMEGYILSFSHIPEIALLDSSSNSKDVKGMFMGMSVLNVVGYFPLVGTISGIARIIFALTNKNFGLSSSNDGKEKALREAQLVRAGIECLSLGPILFLVDSVATILLFTLGKDK